MRILHVITELGLGGTQGQLATVATATQQAGHDVKVVSLMPGGENADRLRAAGIAVADLNLRRSLPDPRAVWRLRSHVRRFRPTVVQSWLYHANLLALLATRGLGGTALAWNIRGAGLYEDLKGRTSTIARLLARFSGIPFAVVTNSAAGCEHHARLGYSPRQWAVIPNAIDTALYKPAVDARASLRRELGVPLNAVLVGHVARLDPVKDHEGLLRAAALVSSRSPEIHFVLVGPGVDRSNQRLTGLIAALHLEHRVHLLGSRTDAPRLQAAWDVAVSSSYSEGFPNALAEAMSCAVPCVGTDAGDVRYLLDTTGIVVPPRNSSALADALMTLLDEGETARVGRGRVARERIATHFSADAVVQRYLELYRTTCENPSPLNN